MTTKYRALLVYKCVVEVEVDDDVDDHHEAAIEAAQWDWQRATRIDELCFILED